MTPEETRFAEQLFAGEAPAVAYSRCFPGVSDNPRVAAAKLRAREDVQAYLDSLYSGEQLTLKEALHALSVIARDPEQTTRDRNKAIDQVLKALGAYDRKDDGSDELKRLLDAAPTTEDAFNILLGAHYGRQ